MLHVAVDGREAGLIAVSDAVREEAPAAVAALRARGVKCAMLTGDGPGPARAAAAAVGIDAADTHWSLLPEDKLQMVRAGLLLPPRRGAHACCLPSRRPRLLCCPALRVTTPACHRRSLGSAASSRHLL